MVKESKKRLPRDPGRHQQLKEDLISFLIFFVISGIGLWAIIRITQ